MKIANRYRPFCHRPGTSCVVPQTSFVAIAYPTCLVVQDLLGKHIQIEWALTGLVKDFTLMQDLEKSQVIISGFAKEGFFSYILFLKDKSLVLKVDRAPEGSLKGLLKQEGSSVEIFLKIKDLFHMAFSEPVEPVVALEKLSFGNHKAQDWDLVQRRKNPLEYLPFWFALGQVQNQEPATYNLQECEKLLDSGDKEAFLQKLEEIFVVGFEGLMVPKLCDTNFLGLDFKAANSFALLHEGYKLIRKMIFDQREGRLHILTELPSKFHSGRCLNLMESDCLFDLEWSKKTIRKITITVFEAQTLLFSFQKSLKTFRLKTALHKKGIECSCLEPVVLQPGFYILDQFKK